MNNNLVQYYQERAAEYEEIYNRPGRQDDLKTLTALLRGEFHSKQVLELGCGTGYWTERIAQTAASIDASDINERVIEIARQKNYGTTTVNFSRSDFYEHKSEKKYKAFFGGFIWSHIPIKDLRLFLMNINNLVKTGNTLVFIDNNYVEGSSLPVTETDPEGNTFQIRVLSDGSSHRVLKNFPSPNFVLKQLEGVGMEIEWTALQYFWMVKYKSIANQ